MRIEALSNFVVPSMPAFYKGEKRDILEEDAKQLIKRGLAKEAKIEQMVEKVQEEPPEEKKQKRTSKKVAK